eukprot:jgi/Bigna1/64183/fgenesh1_kg.69_\
MDRHVAPATGDSVARLRMHGSVIKIQSHIRRSGNLAMGRLAGFRSRGWLFTLSLNHIPVHR